MFRAIAIVLILLTLVPPQAVLAVALPQLGEATDSEKKETDEEEAAPEEEILRIPQSLEGPIDPDTYVLGPADELILFLTGSQSKPQILRVLPEGNVVLPNVGAFPAAGMTLSDFRAQLKTALKRYYRNIDIDCQLMRARSFVVYALGEVEKPQAVELVAPFRVSHALLMAGGVRPNGSQRLIEIRENGETVKTVDLFAFYKFGDLEQNPTLKEKQTVYVPPRKALVQVIGEVRLPESYEMIPGETVADIIRFCGGINSRGDADQILLERTLTGEHMKLTLETADQYPLQDMDIVVVRDELSFEKNDPVQVVGGGGRTGAIQIENPEPLSEFLSRLWRFQPTFNTQTGVLERDFEDGTITYIPFNVREVLAGDSLGGATMVEPGDIVSIHLRDEEVYVIGEVFKPSAVPFLSGYPAERYVSLGGGPTDQGDINRLRIYSLDGSRRSGDRNSTVFRGETIEVRRKKSKIFGSLFLGMMGLTSLVLSIVALSNTK